MSSLMQSLPRPPETAGFEERFLARAFASFTEAAASLERSYTQLQAELARLRRELEDSNRDLAHSLEDNRSMRQHLDRILDGLPCGVLVGDRESGRVELVNPEARRLLGCADAAPIHDLAGLPAWQAALSETPENGEEQVFHCAQAAVEWVALRRAPLETAAGPEHSIFILRDVTESKRFEAEREELRRRQALADMATMLAHEIRNPLGSLELFAGLLVETRLEAEAQQWVLQMQAGLRTLAATVNNVLHFHSLPVPELAPLDLGHLLTSSVQFLGPLAGQAGVRLELDHRLTGVFVAADRHRLEQVMLNLALNAFRFMPQGGVLRIAGGMGAEGPGRDLSKERDGNKERDRNKERDQNREENDPGNSTPGYRPWPRVWVEVRDSGGGIAPENLERIFVPGFTTRPGSPGLGLAVCRAVMEQHSGEIRVFSQPGEGTRFRLEFPVLGAQQ